MSNKDKRRAKFKTLQGGKPVGKPSPSSAPAPEPDDVDWEDFWHPASDDKGHGAKLSCRVPPDVAEQIEIYRGSDQFKGNYRTASDLMRHALVRHLRWLSALKRRRKEAPQDAPLVRYESICRMLREEEMAAGFTGTLDRMQQLCVALESGGHKRRAVSLAARTLREVEAMEDGYWRDRWREELKTRLSRFLAEVPKAKW